MLVLDVNIWDKKGDGYWTGEPSDERVILVYRYNTDTHIREDEPIARFTVHEKELKKVKKMFDDELTDIWCWFSSLPVKLQKRILKEM